MENNILNDTQSEPEQISEKILETIIEGAQLKRSKSDKNESGLTLRRRNKNDNKSQPKRSHSDKLKKSTNNIPEPKLLTNPMDDNSNVCIGDQNSIASASFKNCVVIGNGGMATTSGQFVLGSQSHPIVSTHTVGKGGNAMATPIAPEEYLIVNFNGNLRKIPLYNI